MRGGIPTKVVALLLLPALGAVGALAAFYAFLEATRDDTSFTNLAGRQRMLSEKLGAYAYRVREGDPDYRPAIADLVATFDAALVQLQEGGGPPERRLAGAPEPVQLALSEVVALWRGLHPALLEIAQPTELGATQHAHAKVAAGIDALTRASDAVVGSYEDWSAAQRAKMFGFLFALLLFDALSIIAAVIVLRRERAAMWEAQRELERARSAAIDASHAKTDFLAKMSHEIRTPLNGIIATADLALRTTGDLRAREYLGIIASAGDALVDIINPALDYARIEARAVELVDVPFEVQALTAGVLELLGPRAAKKGLSVRAAIAPDVPPFVSGDAGRLRQILGNLVDNAIKETLTGGVSVEVARVERTSQRVELRFSVIDTGPGVPEAWRARIFEAFTQGPAGDRASGTGLGLAICAQLAALMGGDLKLAETSPEGSRFTLTVPFSRASPETGVAAEGAPRSSRRLRVLLAEDDDLNRMVLGRMLQTLGHDVLSVPDGAEALAALERSHFDALLLDVQMRPMGGLETTTRVRAQEVQSGESPARIVLVTALASEPDRVRGMEAGADVYLTKPLRLADLSVALHMDGLSAEPVSDARPQLELSSGGDPELARKLVENFLAEREALLAALRSATTSSNPEALANAAHRLHSAFVWVAGEEEAASLGELEQRARRGWSSELAPLVAAAEREVQARCQAMAAIDWRAPFANARKVGERT